MFYNKRRAPQQNRNWTTGKPNRFNRARTVRTINPSLLVKKAGPIAQQEAYKPFHSFEDFAITAELKQNIKAHGYVQPTPIQDSAIPHLLGGRDVVGIANTGTGKTAAFIIPILNKIHADRSQKALIIAPTRELAVQIQQECTAFVRGLNIYSLICIGGVGIGRQIQGLRRNPHIVIGTPGRLKDLKNNRHLNFGAYQTIVLDEVDRMLDMGFIHDIKFIISNLPVVRQSLFFSATLSGSVRDVMHTFLKNPVTVSVKTQETPQNVDQDIIKTNGKMKLDVLHELLLQEDFRKVLVFGRTKWGVEKLARALGEKGHKVASIHGNKNQMQRQRALEYFKENRVTVLLATDVASRGLDIADITHVINYDLPETYEDYVHRIGRTGRANKKGIALSFVD